MNVTPAGPCRLIYLLPRGRLLSTQHAPLGQRRESVFRHIEDAIQRQAQAGAKGL